MSQARVFGHTLLPLLPFLSETSIPFSPSAPSSCGRAELSHKWEKIKGRGTALLSRAQFLDSTVKKMTEKIKVVRKYQIEKR